MSPVAQPGCWMCRGGQALPWWPRAGVWSSSLQPRKVAMARAAERPRRGRKRISGVCWVLLGGSGPREGCWGTSRVCLNTPSQSWVKVLFGQQLGWGREMAWGAAGASCSPLQREIQGLWGAGPASPLLCRVLQSRVGRDVPDIPGSPLLLALSEALLGSGAVGSSWDWASAGPRVLPLWCWGPFKLEAVAGEVTGHSQCRMAGRWWTTDWKCWTAVRVPDVWPGGTEASLYKKRGWPPRQANSRAAPSFG